MRPKLLHTDYFIIGADIRGIDQNNDLNGTSSARSIFKYNEDGRLESMTAVPLPLAPYCA